MRRLNKKYWPHRVVLKSKNYDEFDEMRAWLHNKMPERDQWQVVNGVNVDQFDFYFKSSNDAMMFSLRWGAV